MISELDSLHYLMIIVATSEDYEEEAVKEVGLASLSLSTIIFLNTATTTTKVTIARIKREIHPKRKLSERRASSIGQEWTFFASSKDD